jgi:hypothetical protein
VKLVLRALVAHPPLAKISRVIPRASVAILVRAFSGRSAAVGATVAATAVAGARIHAVAVQTPVADVLIAADVPAADHVSNAVPAAPGMTVVIKVVVLEPRAVRSLFPKC